MADEKNTFLMALYGKEELQIKFVEWWKSLKEDPGARARLRRCASPEEAALLSETYQVMRIIPWCSGECAATIAGIVSHIEEGENEKISLAVKLAKPKKKNDRVPFSESRFRHLLSCKTWNEFYTDLRRAVQILGRTVNPLSVIDVIIAWDNELKRKQSEAIRKSIKFELSRQYYTQLMES